MFGTLNDPQKILILNSDYGISALGLRTVLKMHKMGGTIVGIDDKPHAEWHFQKIDQMNTTQGMKFHFIHKSIHTLPEEFFGEISNNFDLIFASPEPNEYNRMFNLLKHLYMKHGAACVIEYKTQPEYYDRILCGYDFDYRRQYHRFYELIGFEIDPFEHLCKDLTGGKDLRYILPAYYRNRPDEVWKEHIVPPEFSGFIYEQYIKWNAREFKDVH